MYLINKQTSFSLCRISGLLTCLFLACIVIGVTAVEAVDETVLGISADGRFFTINGEPTFLNGVSYYGALTASDNNWTADLNDMQARGFNWIRVFVCHDTYLEHWEGEEHYQCYAGSDVSVMDDDGTVIPYYMDRLKTLIGMCNDRGMIVDCTLYRGTGVHEPGPDDQDQHEACVQTLGIELPSSYYKNVYFDLFNEWDSHGGNDTMVHGLVEALNGVDEFRLCTASSLPEDPEKFTIEEILNTGIDFLAPHLSRKPETAEQMVHLIQGYIDWMNDHQKRVPILSQEPMRQGYNDWLYPGLVDYFRDLSNCKVIEMAGWCFHNYTQNDNIWVPACWEPWRCFEMVGQRLFTQLVPVEHAVVDGAKTEIGDNSWLTRRYQAEYGDVLGHDLGYFAEDLETRYWEVGAGTPVGWVTTGPRIDTLPAGPFKAGWRMRISGGTGTTIVTISVVMGQSEQFLASRTITRSEFGGSGWKEFYVKTPEGSDTWWYDNPGTELSFKTWWHKPRGTTMDLDYITVERQRGLNITPNGGYFNLFPELKVYHGSIIPGERYRLYFGVPGQTGKVTVGDFIGDNGFITVHPGSPGVHIPSVNELYSSYTLPAWAVVRVDRLVDGSWKLMAKKSQGFMYDSPAVSGDGTADNDSIYVVSEEDEASLGPAGEDTITRIGAMSNGYPFVTDRFYFVSRRTSPNEPETMYFDKNGGDLRTAGSTNVLSLNKIVNGQPAGLMPNVSQVLPCYGIIYPAWLIGLHPLAGSPTASDHTFSRIYYDYPTIPGGFNFSYETGQFFPAIEGYYCNPFKAEFFYAYHPTGGGYQSHVADKTRDLLWINLQDPFMINYDWLINFTPSAPSSGCGGIARTPDGRYVAVSLPSLNRVKFVDTWLLDRDLYELTGGYLPAGSPRVPPGLITTITVNSGPTGIAFHEVLGQLYAFVAATATTSSQYLRIFRIEGTNWIERPSLDLQFSGTAQYTTLKVQPVKEKLYLNLPAKGELKIIKINDTEFRMSSVQLPGGYTPDDMGLYIGDDNGTRLGEMARQIPDQVFGDPAARHELRSLVDQLGLNLDQDNSLDVFGSALLVRNFGRGHMSPGFFRQALEKAAANVMADRIDRQLDESNPPSFTLVLEEMVGLLPADACASPSTRNQLLARISQLAVSLGPARYYQALERVAELEELVAAGLSDPGLTDLLGPVILRLKALLEEHDRVFETALTRTGFIEELFTAFAADGIILPAAGTVLQNHLAQLNGMLEERKLDQALQKITLFENGVNQNIAEDSNRAMVLFHLTDIRTALEVL